MHHRPEAPHHPPHRRRRIRAALASVAALALGLATLGPAAAQDEEAPSTTWRFDFGGPSSPVEEGWTQVTPTTLYSEELGYGLDREVVFRDRSGPDAVRRDFVLTNGFHFLVDLPNGEYHVTIISGDDIANNNTAVSVQGENQGTMQPRNAGEFSAHELFTEVVDGQLEFQFRNDGRANGIVITQVFAPEGLQATDVTLAPEPAVTLSWEAAPGAAHYTVYRAPSGQGDLAPVGTTTSPGFVDESVDLGYTYDYAVTQITAEDIESALSDPITVAVLDESVAAPAAPVVTLERANPSATVLRWNPVEDALWYHVYLGYSENGPFERVATLEGTRYVHEGRTTLNHYYRVVAVNEGGLSHDSDLLLTPITTPGNRGEALPGCGEGRFDAQVLQTGQSWRVLNGGTTVHTGFSIRHAIQAALDSLTPDRTSQERVVVRGSGVMTADTSIDIPSHTSLEVCGTIDVSGNEGDFSYERHQAPIRIRHAQDISIPYLSVTGNPNFAIYVRTSEDLHFGHVDLRLRGGHGVRIDSRDDDSVREARNIRMDHVYVSGTTSHGVETYGVDGFSVGTVVARDVGYSGVLLNDTVNATIDLVDAVGAGTGTGYAAFRMANRNGQVDGEYPTNIRIGEVRARGGGRGIFCVSQSGGAVIEKVDIAGSGSNAVLIENCHNVAISGGVIEGPGDVRIAARSEFANTSDVTLENFTLRNSAINENPCGENIVVRGITLENSSINTCG